MGMPVFRTLNSPDRATVRLSAYCITAAAMIIGAFAFSGTQWQSSAYEHTTGEAAVTLLAALIGAIAVLRYCARRSGPVLLIACGFLGTAAINGVHTYVTTESYIAYMPYDFGLLMGMSDMAVQQLLAIVLLSSALAGHRRVGTDTDAKDGHWWLCVGAFLLALVVFTITNSFQIPAFEIFGIAFPNAKEIIPGLFLMAAFAAYFVKGDWKRHAFDHWVMIAIILACASDVIFMARSSWVFDFEFNTAHLLKLVSFLCVLTGLMTSLYHALRDEEQRADQLHAAKTKAEHALAEIACHKMALDQHAIVIFLNLQGRISDGNDQFCTLTGYSRQELAGPDGQGLHAGAIFASSFDDLWWTVCSGGTWKGEVEVRDKSGSHHHFATTVVPFRNERGHITYFMVVQTDVTDHRNAEQELVNHAALTDMMNSISVAANQSEDIQAATEYCLKRICDFTGWTLGQVFLLSEGRKSDFHAPGWWYSYSPETHLPFKTLTEDLDWVFGMGLPGHVFVDGQPRYWNDTDEVEWWHRVEAFDSCQLRGGAAFPVNVKGQVVAILEFWAPFTIEASPRVKEVLAHTVLQLGQVFERCQTEQELLAHRDHLQELVDEATASLKDKATELRQALDKEKELNALQRQFVSMASHEFRTPLAIIDSAAQRMKSRLARDRLTPEDATNRIDKIRSAVKRMTRLMESTLSAARMQDGKIRIELGPCNIAKIVHEVCDRQQELAPSHTITCEAESVPATIRADSGALEQVLSNLLSNAVKYAPDAPEIAVRAFTEGADVVFSVQDKGLGIDAEELARVGQRFFRAKTSTGIEGTGIGLNLVKTLVNLHGGLLNIESRKDEGSTFVVRLPIEGPSVSGSEQIKAA